MLKIDEQISQILKCLSPLQSSIVPLSQSTVVTNPFAVGFQENVVLSDTNQSSSSTASEMYRPNRKAPMVFSRSKRLSSENENEFVALSIPPPPSVYNRSAHSSNRIAPAPTASNSTIIELESNVSSSTPIKSGNQVFRRFMSSTRQQQSERNAKSSTSSSKLLYTPTSDDERPSSPVSSAGDDDDYRPLTSSQKSHHHTLL